MLGASDSTHSLENTTQTSQQDQGTLSNTNDASSEVVKNIDVSSVLGRVPIKNKTRNPIVKRVNPSCVRYSTTPSVSPDIPTSKTKADNSVNDMTSQHDDTLGTDNVNHSVTSFDLDPKMSKFVSFIKTSERLVSDSMNQENPRTVEKSVQTNMVDKLIATNTEESPSGNLVINHKFVMSKTPDILLADSPKKTQLCQMLHQKSRYL